MTARFALLLLCLLGFAAPSYAAPTLPESLYYRLSWGGITLGRIRFSATETETSYHVVVDTKSKGIASIFSPFETVAQTRGIKRGGQYIPGRYDTNSVKSDEGENRTGHIRYDANGHITERITSDPDDPAWRPVVPLEKADKATDPVTGFVQLRHAILKAAQQGIKQVSVRTYDNKRLAEIKATLLPPPAVEASEHLIRTHITRTPLDGYTPKEWKKFRQGDPALTVTFATATMMPTRVELQLMLGTITATLTKE